MRRTLLVVITASFLAGCSESVNGQACPYGTNSGQSNTNSSTTCKVRPDPDAAQSAAVRDGSAWRGGFRAHTDSAEAAAKLIGVGLNRWGDVTFTKAEGEGDDRLITYERTGRKAAQDVPSRRGYVEVTFGSDTFTAEDVDAAGLPKVLNRVRRAVPGARLREASFGTAVSGATRKWTLMYSDGLLVLAGADGSGACAFSGTFDDLPRCGPGDLLPSAPSGAGLPAAPKLPAVDPRLECVRAAGGDVTKLAKCAG